MTARTHAQRKVLAALAAERKPSMISRAVDAAIEVVSPTWARRRAGERAAISASKLGSIGGRGKHEHAERDRLTESWVAAGGSGNQFVMDLPELRRRSRSLYEHDGHAKSIIDKRKTGVVGTGIRPQPNATPEATGLSAKQCEEWNRACRDQFYPWADHEADATGEQSFWELQALWYHAWRVDGECLIHPLRIVDEKEGPERRYGRMALETVDVDRLDNPTGEPNRRIIEGVEVGGRGQHLAYWVRPEHPDEIWRPGSINKPERVPRWVGERANILHLYERYRAGQMRGMPYMACALVLFHLLRRYIRDEVVAAAVTARIAMFIKRNGGEMPLAGLEWNEGEKSYIENWQPGTVEYLGPGEEIQPFAPTRPSGQFDPFTERVLRCIGAGLNVPYAIFVGHFKEANYGSMRAALLQMWKGDDYDSAILVRRVLQPVYELKIEELYFLGKLPTVRNFAEIRRQLCNAVWVPPPRGWIDPSKDIEASERAIAGMLSNYETEGRTVGIDFESNARAVAQQKAVLVKLEQEFKLPPGTLLNGSQQAGKSSAQGGADPAAEPADGTEEDRKEDREDANDQ